MKQRELAAHVTNPELQLMMSTHTYVDDDRTARQPVCFEKDPCNARRPSGWW
jgi:hypothetical protein